MLSISLICQMLPEELTVYNFMVVYGNVVTIFDPNRFLFGCQVLHGNMACLYKSYLNSEEF